MRHKILQIIHKKIRKRRRSFFLADPDLSLQDGKPYEQDSKIGRLPENQRRFLQPYTLRWIHHYRFLHYNAIALHLRAPYVRHLYFLIKSIDAMFCCCSFLRPCKFGTNGKIQEWNDAVGLFGLFCHYHVYLLGIIILFVVYYWVN